MESERRKEKMAHATLLLAAFVVILSFGEPVLAQHGPVGGNSGHGSVGGMTNMPGGALGGHSGNNSGLSTNQHSQGDLAKGHSGAAGNTTASELLTQNSKLSSNLQGLLPTGTSLQDAAKGFDHLGQFVAAVHVSKNLSIPFDQLKREMMNGNSLGGAIHTLRPNVDSRQEALKANQQALDDMEKTMSSPNVAGATR